MGRRSRVGYKLLGGDGDDNDKENIVWVQQDTAKADGLGGIVSPAAWALCCHLEEDIPVASEGVVVELGAGAGMRGIFMMMMQ